MKRTREGKTTPLFGGDVKCVVIPSVPDGAVANNASFIATDQAGLYVGLESELFDWNGSLLVAPIMCTLEVLIKPVWRTSIGAWSLRAGMSRRRPAHSFGARGGEGTERKPREKTLAMTKVNGNVSANGGTVVVLPLCWMPCCSKVC